MAQACGGRGARRRAFPDGVARAGELSQFSAGLISLLLGNLKEVSIFWRSKRIAQSRRLCRHGFVDILLLSRVHAHQRFDRLDHPLSVPDKIAVDLL